MVIALGIVQLIKIRTDVLSYGLRGTEIHGCALHRTDLACRNGHGIRRGEMISIQPNQMLEDAAAVLPGNIKIRMVREVEYGVLICTALVMKVYRVVLGKGIGDAHIRIAGIALVTVRRMEGEADEAALL